MNFDITQEALDGGIAPVFGELALPEDSSCTPHARHLTLLRFLLFTPLSRCHSRSLVKI